MFKRETEYALRGLTYIQLQNYQNRRPGVIEIAKKIDAPPYYIAKILQRMVKLGFVLSLKGKNGGFYFEKDKAKLPLKNIIIAIEGEKLMTDCGFGLNKCDQQKPCPLHNQYRPIREAINTLVSNETIQSLAKKYSKL